MLAEQVNDFARYTTTVSSSMYETGSYIGKGCDSVTDDSKSSSRNSTDCGDRGEFSVLCSTYYLLVAIGESCADIGSKMRVK